MKKSRFLLLLLALCLLAQLAGCKTPEPPAQAQDAPAAEQPVESAAQDDSGKDNESVGGIYEGEPVSCTYPSVEALADAVHAEQRAHWKDSLALHDLLEDVSAVYVPAQGYEGFRLHSIEVNPLNIFLYYVPEDSKADGIDASEDIVLTLFRDPETTLESLCAQHGVSPDAEGYAYSEKTGTLYFECDGTLISISGPKGRNDYDALRALCGLERVEIERYYPAMDVDFEKYGDDALQIALLGEEDYRAYEQAVAALGLEPREAAVQYCTDLTELGDPCAGWTETEREKITDGYYVINTARLRAHCYDENQTTLLCRVASQYERFQNGDRSALGPDPGPGQSRDDAELYYDLTGLTVFHPAIPNAKLRVSVNCVECGNIRLNADGGCTLIPIDVPERAADRPVLIELRLLDAPADTDIRVYVGLDSNISRAN